MKIKSFLPALLALAIASDAFAGWVFIQNSEGERQTSFIQDNKMRFVAPDHILIFDLNKHNICFANPKEKTYWSGSPDEFSAQVRKGAENLDKMLEQQLAQVPPQQREAFKQAIRQQIKTRVSTPAAKVEIRLTEKFGKVAGYNVRKYEILINGQLRQDQWIAKDIRMHKTFDVKRFGKMMRAFHAGFGKGGEDVAFSSPQVMGLLEKGWPLRKTDYDDEGYRETEEVIKVRKKQLRGSLFDSPKGYRRISMREIFGK